MHSPAPLPQHLKTEIDQLRPQFEALYPGMDIDAAVALWVGKPNRFTRTVMHSVLDVLHYMSAEHADAQARASAPAHAQPAHAQQAAHADDAVPAQAPRTDTRSPDRVVRDQQIAAANAQWREAVRLRREAILQWDGYVAALRRKYQELKNGQ